MNTLQYQLNDIRMRLDRLYRALEEVLDILDKVDEKAADHARSTLNAWDD